MANFEQTLAARDGLSSAVPDPHLTQGVKTVILLALLLAYAIGFALLYPITQASVERSAAEGNDPNAWEMVGP